MSTLLKEIGNDDLKFDTSLSQQFATVVFDRGEDDETSLITIVKDGKINQFNGHNKYNPSKRRHSSCVYIKEEDGDNIIKICTIQHKGNTLLEIHKVTKDELSYLFKEEL